MPQPEAFRILPFEPSYQEAVVALAEEVLCREYRVRSDLTAEEDLLDIAQAYAPPHGRFLLAVVSDALVATGGVRRISATDCELRRLYVLASHRRKGIASALVAHLVEFTREQAYNRMLLEISEEMRDTIHRYGRYGFGRVTDVGSLPRPGSFLAIHF